MLPHVLVRKILEKRGLTPYTAAKAMKRPSFQPTLHKYLNDHIKEPTHGTAKRIADFCGIPLEAIYDAAVATRLARELGLEETVAPAPEPTVAVTALEPVPIHSGRRSQQLPAALLARIAELSPQHFKSLVQLVTIHLDGVAPQDGAQSSKQAAG